ncbi:MAG: CooT family nickel-binding protein [Desulfobacterales bacterium]
MRQGRQQKVMQDAAKMEFREDGYLLVGLLGDQKTIVGRITKIDFMDDHSVIFETET